MEEERHKREMALQLEQVKIEAERRRQEREHELAFLQLLTRNAIHAHNKHAVISWTWRILSFWV